MVGTGEASGDFRVRKRWRRLASEVGLVQALRWLICEDEEAMAAEMGSYPFVQGQPPLSEGSRKEATLLPPPTMVEGRRNHSHCFVKICRIDQPICQDFGAADFDKWILSSPINRGLR